MTTHTPLPTDLDQIIEAIIGQYSTTTPFRPSSRLPVTDSTEAPPNSTYILRVQRPEGRTWVTLSPEHTWGCPECATLKIDALRRRYPIDDTKQYQSSDVVELLSCAWSIYNIPLAITELYDKQVWSIVTPAPRCQTCATRKSSVHTFVQHLTRLLAYRSGAPDVNSEPREIYHAFEDSRSVTPNQFIHHNRWAIGYLSIMANPVMVHQSDTVHLINSPVTTGPTVLGHEVAGGKGGTLEQALASCIGEGLERYFLALNCQLATRSASASDLREEGELIFDPVSDAGYPANDPLVKEYTATTTLEWVPGQAFSPARNICHSVQMPANILYCPYRPLEGTAEFSVGSTNGAAAAATPLEAMRQGVFELIERDAFWYYSRHGGPVVTLARGLVDEYIPSESTFPGVFTFQLLPSPFAINICQVTYVQETEGGVFTARGTGAKLAFKDALQRAYYECAQLIFSLEMDDQVESPLDMRSLWQSGLALQQFPWFFDTEGMCSSKDFIPTDYSGTELVASIAAQNLTVFWTILAETDTFAVAHSALKSIGLMDSSYYVNNGRFRTFEQLLDYGQQTVRYAGPLFM